MGLEKLESSLVSRVPIQDLIQSLKEYLKIIKEIDIVDLMTRLNLWLEDSLRIIGYLYSKNEINIKNKKITLSRPKEIKNFKTIKKNQWLLKWDLDPKHKIQLNNSEKKILKTFVSITKGRPSNDDKIDQYYSIPETNIKRLRLISKEILVKRKNICFLGDDDLTSLVFGISRKFHKIVVFDIDRRIVDYINKACMKLGIKNCRAVVYDYREPLKTKQKFDIFHSDPPATNEAIELVLKRAKQLSNPGSVFYLSWPEFICDPRYLLKIQETYINNGWLITGKYPDFNEYDNLCFFNYLGQDDWKIIERLGISKNYFLSKDPMQRYCLTRLLLVRSSIEKMKKYRKEIYLSNIHKIPSGYCTKE